MMTNGQRQIVITVGGAICTYIVGIAKPPETWWGWVLFFAGLGGNVFMAVRALYISSVTDERDERKAAADAIPAQASATAEIRTNGVVNAPGNKP